MAHSMQRLRAMLRWIALLVIFLTAPMRAHAQDDPPIAPVRSSPDAFFTVPAPPRHVESEPGPVDSLERGASLAPAIHGALIGQFLAYAAGAFAGAWIYAQLGCDPEIDCGWDIALSAAVTATFIGPLGSAAGAIAGAEFAGQHGASYAPFWATILNMVIAPLTLPLALEFGDEVAATVLLLVQSIMNPTLMAVFYEPKEPIQRPVWQPTVGARRGGLTVGVAGAF